MGRFLLEKQHKLSPHRMEHMQVISSEGHGFGPLFVTLTVTTCMENKKNMLA